MGAILVATHSCNVVVISRSLEVAINGQRWALPIDFLLLSDFGRFSDVIYRCLFFARQPCFVNLPGNSSHVANTEYDSCARRFWTSPPSWYVELQ
jgi:hypothetical protein